jgi:hypothetical protein
MEKRRACFQNLSVQKQSYKGKGLLMQELALVLSTLLVLFYIAIDRWLVTPRYFVPLYIAVSILIIGLTF